MSKYISLLVTGPPVRVQYIQVDNIVAVEPDGNTETKIHILNATTFTIQHDDDSTANRSMCDAVTSALLDINSYKNMNVSTEVVMPTIAGVPIEISSISYS